MDDGVDAVGAGEAVRPRLDVLAMWGHKGERRDRTMPLARLPSRRDAAGFFEEGGRGRVARPDRIASRPLRGMRQSPRFVVVDQAMNE